MPALEKGLQTARNFGGAIVTGVHAFAKLKEVYGENMAMTLSSLARSKLILATADRETATWCSDFIGHRQVKDMEEGYSYGYNNARDAVSLTPRRQIEPLLLPDQFMNLPRLSGYLKFPDGFPAAPVTLVPRRWPRMAEGFIARQADPDPKPAVSSDDVSDSVSSALVRAEPVEGAPAANDDGAGKPVVPRQLKLNLPDVKEEPEGSDRSAQEQARSKPSQELSPPTAEGAAGTASRSADVPASATTLPPAPLMAGRNEAADDAQPSPENKGTSQAKQAAAGKMKVTPLARPEERASARERAERDLLEGDVGSDPQDFYEPDL